MRITPVSSIPSIRGGGYREITCDQCKGTGTTNVGDEWTGSLEGKCSKCKGRGTIAIRNIRTNFY